MTIQIGKSVATQLADVESGTVRDYLRASAVTLALWIADNWWRLRWESLRDNRRPSADWRLRHELTSAPGGTIWPPMMIYGSGDFVVVAPAYGANLSQGPVRFLDLSAVHTIPGSVYEAGVDTFFRSVIDACMQAEDGPALIELVRQLALEREDRDVAAWRSLEARLGFDPDEAPDGLIESLTEMEAWLGEAAVEEAATAAPGAKAQEVLAGVVEASEASEIVADLAVADSIAPKLSHDQVVPWRQGEAAAEAVRKFIAMPKGPIPNETLGELMATSWVKLRDAPATAQHFPYAARRLKGETTEKLALQTKFSVDRRFELSRVLGDAIWAPNADFGVISRAKTERQKFQRAFAQSLLCPYSDLRNHVDLAEPLDEDIELAATFFNVRPNVVQTLLVNKGVLPRETLEQRLEAA
jgi:hypothetical protein